MKKKLIKIIINIIKKSLFLNFANKFSCMFSEEVELIFTHKKDSFTYHIFTPNSMNLYRARTYFSKEPDMILWIDEIPENSVLMDIGANIGLYSIYAASKGIEVLAIEPESQNYGLLNKNIYLNGLSHKIKALNIGMNDVSGLTTLYIPKFEAGAALNNLGENLDWQKKSFIPDFQQSVFSYSLDDFFKLYKGKFPTHLKIDVDGIERKIINGAVETLKNSNLKQIIIELNTESNEDLEIIELFNKHGFIETSHRSTDENGIFSALTNFIFKRA